MDLNKIMEVMDYCQSTDLQSFEVIEGNSSISFQKGMIPNHADADGGICVVADERVENGELTRIELKSYEPVQAETEAPHQSQESSEVCVVTAPFVGVINLNENAKVFEIVKKDEVICSIEAMKLLNNVTVPVNGTITEILVKEGSLVEYDQPLMKIKVG